MKQIALMTLATIAGKIDNGMRILLASESAKEMVLKPINLLTELMMAGVSAYGVWIIIKAVPDITDGWSNKDDTGFRNAAMRFFGGLIIAALDPILHWLGVM